MRHPCHAWFVLVALWLGAAPSAAAAQDFESVEIVTHDLGGGLFMLVGRGGNIGMSIGADGVFLVDDQFAPLTPKILAAIAKLSADPVRFVINTHWHGDHTGGNENLGSAGALIVAHDKVRERMSVEQFMQAFGRRVPAAPKAALPVITFAETISFHLNGERIEVFHVETAHTDGDAIVHFAIHDVFHMGDTFFNGGYPFIDIESGGSIDGMIAAADRVIALSDGQSKIIPGHGALSDRAGLRAYRAMLGGVRDAIAKALEARKSVEEVVSHKPTAAFDSQWGDGFVKPDDFVRSVYRSLAP